MCRISTRAAFPTVLVLGATLFSGCGTCGEEVVAQHPSPDGEHVAILFVRNCGATTPYVTHVNIADAARELDTDWDGAIRARQIASYKDREPVEILWSSTSSIVLTADRRALINCDKSLARVAVQCRSR